MHKRPEELGPREARLWIRSGEWTGPTAGLAAGYVQAGLVILPQASAHDVERRYWAEPGALLLDVTEPGSAVPRRAAPDADLRLDLPRYRVYRAGLLEEEPTDIMTLWHDDFVAFLILPSRSWEIAIETRSPLLITHAPGHLFITDLRIEEVTDVAHPV